MTFCPDVGNGSYSVFMNVVYSNGTMRILNEISLDEAFGSWDCCKGTNPTLSMVILSAEKNLDLVPCNELEILRRTSCSSA